MNLFCIGDVHGHYDTFKNLVEKYWDVDSEILVQVGDLIDRGPNSPKAVEYARFLQKEHPNQTVFLKGNHEFEAIVYQQQGRNDNWMRQCGEATLIQYEKSEQNFEEAVTWFETMPIYWENESVFISHAGISAFIENPFEEAHPNSVLWNRKPLKNIGKVQVFGHTPTSSHFPMFDKQDHSWNIDGGAGMGKHLCGLRLNKSGEFLEAIVQAVEM